MIYPPGRLLIATVIVSSVTVTHNMRFSQGAPGLHNESNSKEKIHDLRNTTVYIGYANNPFASSSHPDSRRTKSRFSITTILEKKTRPNFENTIEPSEQPRKKRGVIHLYNMVSCSTGCNPLIYKGYGCFCGFLGSGYPVDGIDRCCKFHDWCYDAANCPMYLEYFVPYYWKCYHNRPLCAIEHGEYGGYGSCAQRLCECDRVLSECLSQYPCPSSRALCRTSTWRLLQNALMFF